MFLLRPFLVTVRGSVLLLSQQVEHHQYCENDLEKTDFRFLSHGAVFFPHLWTRCPTALSSHLIIFSSLLISLSSARRSGSPSFPFIRCSSQGVLLTFFIYLLFELYIPPSSLSQKLACFFFTSLTSLSQLSGRMPFSALMRSCGC